MIQDAETIFQGDFPISFDCTYQEKNEVWFVGNMNNSLWNMNLDTKELKYAALIPVNGENTFRRNTRCLKFENKIFCLPDLDDKIAIYDMGKDEFRFCKIGGKNEERRSIYNAWICGSTLWCVSYFMQQIIEINLSNISIKGIYPLFEESDRKIGYESAMYEEDIYFVSRNDTVIGRFNLLTKEIQYYELDIDDKGFNTITTDGCNIYVTGYKKAVYIWNLKNNYIKVKNNFPYEYKVCNTNKGNVEEICYDSPIFYRSTIIENYIIFLPWNFPGARSNGILIYDKSEQCILCVKDEELNGKQNSSLYCFSYFDLENTVGLLSVLERHLFEMDINHQIIYQRDFEICGYERMFSDMGWRQNALREQGKIDLKVWLNLIRDQKKKKNMGFGGRSGIVIWDAL